MYEFFAVVVGLHVAVFTPCPYSVISLIRIVNVHRDLAASGTDVIPDLLHRDSPDRALTPLLISERTAQK